MRLLFALPEFPPGYGGGIGTYYGAFLPALVRLGHSVDVVLGYRFASGGEPYEYEGVRVRPLEVGRAEKAELGFSRYAPAQSVQQDLAAAWAMWEQSGGGEGYDVVEVTDWPLLFAPWVGREGPPVLVRLHSSTGQILWHDHRADPRDLTGELAWLLETHLLPYADALEAHSVLNAAEWTGLLRREVPVYPPPFKTQDVRHVPARSGGFAAARIQKLKGPQTLCEALQLLGAEAPVVEWAGVPMHYADSDESYDETLARSYPGVWGTRLRPVGLLEPEDVAQRQAGASFVVVPSLWDVYNLTIPEAMAQEAVVICSTGAGGVDLIQDGANGFSFPAGDAAALAAAIETASALPEGRRLEMGRAARETVQQLLDPDRVAAAAAARYADLARQGPSAITVPGWIRGAVAPSHPVPVQPPSLESYPLRELVRHAARRLRRKLQTR